LVTESDTDFRKRAVHRCGLTFSWSVFDTDQSARSLGQAKKNRGPDQCAPVIRSAITVSER
jgi:hypothetical protein